MKINLLIACLATASLAVALQGCGGDDDDSVSNGAGDTHVHEDGTVHTDHGDIAASDEAPAPGHGGATIELGTATIGPFSVRASRDEGPITAGGDAPIDVWLTDGESARVTAVRFWIGTESGEESVKALADIENPSEPNHWHTHAEVPSPLPAGSKLWVEIEVNGQKHSGSFDLNI